MALLGDVDQDVVLDVEASLGARFALPVRRLDRRFDPQAAYDITRRQYGSALLLRRLVEAAPPGAVKILGLTEHDLFIPMLSFLFGQAQVGGVAALVSLARLRPEFHGWPPEPALLRERARKECFHELGHAFGLVHCEDRGCVMSLSTALAQVDAKRAEYCQDCQALLPRAGFGSEDQ